jgi:hypothetical protein
MKEKCDRQRDPGEGAGLRRRKRPRADKARVANSADDLRLAAILAREYPHMSFAEMFPTINGIRAWVEAGMPPLTRHET